VLIFIIWMPLKHRGFAANRELLDVGHDGLVTAMEGLNLFDVLVSHTF
jgi:hypothetical protein